MVQLSGPAFLLVPARLASGVLVRYGTATLDWMFVRGPIECAIMKLIPQRMAYLPFGPEGPIDRRGTA